LSSGDRQDISRGYGAEIRGQTTFNVLANVLFPHFAFKVLKLTIQDLTPAVGPLPLVGRALARRPGLVAGPASG